MWQAFGGALGGGLGMLAGAVGLFVSGFALGKWMGSYG
jgi:hypothetical protein